MWLKQIEMQEIAGVFSSPYDDKVLPCIDPTVRFQYYSLNRYQCAERLLSKEQTKSAFLMIFFNDMATNLDGMVSSTKDGSSGGNNREGL